MMLDYLTYAALAIVVIIFLFSAIRILREYERGVVFTLGRFTGVKGPGLIILIPAVQQMVKVDLRVMVQEVPPQDVISRDNVSVKVNAVLYFRIINPERAIIKVSNFMAATSQLAQTTLRSVLGKHELDEMLAERDRLNADIQEILDQQTDAWGIKVTTVEIKDVDLNETMVRAIAQQAEAERLRRANLTSYEGCCVNVSYLRTPGSGALGGLTTSRGLSPSVWNDALAIRSKNSPLRLGESFPSPSVQPS